MVVKNSIVSPPKDNHKDELKVLRHLTASRKIKKAPDSIIRLVWDPALKSGDDCYEFVDKDWDPTTHRVQFGITPVGVQFDLSAFETPDNLRNAMNKLLDGLDWLHTTARVIHRDLRPVNVILDRNTKSPVIIDFDCAFQLPVDGSLDGTGFVQLTTYAGGLNVIGRKVIYTCGFHLSLSYTDDDLCIFSFKNSILCICKYVYTVYPV